MKLIPRFLPFLLLLITARDSFSEQLPEYRPALLGFHRRSLINLINAESLMKRGQGDAIVMFSCGISDQGYAGGARTYRESPNSELLKKELFDRIEQSQFEPAVYNHSHVATYISGTVNFFVRDGKGHVRIFLNQEEEDLKSGRNFIAPQFAWVPGNVKFRGIFYPPAGPGHEGVASLKLSVDATGHVQGARVEYEYPPGMNYGAQTVGPIRDARFIPGFRNSRPVSCQFTWSLIYGGMGHRMKTG